MNHMKTPPNRTKIITSYLEVEYYEFKLLSREIFMQLILSFDRAHIGSFYMFTLLHTLTGRFTDAQANWVIILSALIRYLLEV